MPCSTLGPTWPPHLFYALPALLMLAVYAYASAREADERRAIFAATLPALVVAPPVIILGLRHLFDARAMTDTAAGLALLLGTLALPIAMAASDAWWPMSAASLATNVVRVLALAWTLGGCGATCVSTMAF